MLKRFALCVVAASLAVPVLATAASAGPMEIDAVSHDYNYTGVPHHITPQVVQFNFENQGDHAHMMLLARKREGVKRSWKGIIATNHGGRFAKIYGETHAEPGEVGKSIKPQYLTQGRYALICFFQNNNNSPPHFTLGMLRKFQVVK